MASRLNGAELQDMVRHWLSVPPNGYLGSGYGTDVMALLQNPMAAGVGDAFIRKMRQDLPIIGALPPDVVNAWFEDKGNDTKLLHIDVLDSRVSINNLGEIV